MFTIPVKSLAGGFAMPVYGYGMGRKYEATAKDDAAEVERIRTAIGLGVTHFDTAELYGEGRAEVLLGRAIAPYPREEMFITTKAVSWNLSYGSIRQAVTGSLERLQTNYIDLYLMHRYPEPGVPIADTMRALNKLVDEGAIRHIGASNFSPYRMQQAQRYSRAPLVCNQVHYNIQHREIEHAGILQQCQADNILLAAWRPLQHGLLAGNAQLQALAQKYNKSPAQIAINWLTSQKNVVVISSTSSIAHLKENIGALDWQMEEADIAMIRREFPDQQSVSDLVPLNYPGSDPAFIYP